MPGSRSICSVGADGLQVSVRQIIMTALKANGIEIREADMIEDARRLRGADAN